MNRSEVKIGADELAAVTQLFTEPYMVSFLLDNSLGAWWASRRLPDLTEAALTGAGTRKRNCAERRRCPVCRSTICASCATTEEKEPGLRGGVPRPARSTAGPSSSKT